MALFPYIGHVVGVSCPHIVQAMRRLCLQADAKQEVGIVWGGVVYGARDTVPRNSAGSRLLPTPVNLSGHLL